MPDPNLELLQAMVQRVLDSIARLETGQREVVQRLGRLERLTADLHTDWTSQSVRMDNLGERLARIETRIGLVEG
jgi:hypothetical protein